MSKIILIDGVYPEETRVVIHENNLIQDFDYETAAKKQIKGNIYLAKITRVEPSLQAAFIEYGPSKHGFLPFSEIHPDYFHIPISDRNGDNTDHLESSNVEISNTLRSIDPPVFSNEEHEDNVVIENIAAENAAENNSITQQNSDASEEKLPLDSSKEEENREDEDIEEIETEHNEERQETFNPYKAYRIQEVIKKNQIILVQVIKEERGNKGATFTSFISLAGRYCVLMPNSDKQSGISRRIDDIEDRKRLKSIISGLLAPTGVSVIVRTAGARRSKADITRDYDYLVRLWNNIREHILSSKAPSFIHAEGDLIKRTIRDLYDNSISDILVQGDSSFKKAKEFTKMIMPACVNKVKQYKSKVPIFAKYQIDSQLSALYSPIADLKSGGYIVINQTEALISIDVNSGRSTSERNIEETATKTNLEAVYETARQLRLRDLSGLIVIDFIDMADLKNRKLIEKEMREAFKTDRAKIQLGSISIFGLFELSRQRLRPSFIEANGTKCASCNGKGMVRAPESNAVLILRTIENEICKGDYEQANLYTSPEVAIYLLNYKRKDIADIEAKYNTKIMFNQDPHATPDSFSIERIKTSSTLKEELPVNIDPVYDDGSIIEEEKVITEPKTNKKNWKSRFNKGSEIEEKKTVTPDVNKRFNKKPVILPKVEEVKVEEVKEEEKPVTNKLPHARRKKYHRNKASNQNKIVAEKSVSPKPQETSILKSLWRSIID